MKNKKKLIAISKFSLLIIIMFCIPFYIWFFHKDFVLQFSNFRNVEKFINKSYIETIGFLFVAQILQIIISIIPSQWIQIGGGYFLGFPITFGLSIIGSAMGTIISYYLAFFLGRDAMHMIFGEEKISDLIDQLNSKKAILVIFICFLIPGFPKDVLSYGAGLSEIKLKRFLIVSLIGRSPAMIGSIVFGIFLKNESYVPAIILGVVATICLILGVIFRDKINSWLNDAYAKVK